MILNSNVNPETILVTGMIYGAFITSFVILSVKLMLQDQKRLKNPPLLDHTDRWQRIKECFNRK